LFLDSGEDTKTINRNDTFQLFVTSAHIPDTWMLTEVIIEMMKYGRASEMIIYFTDFL